MSYRMLSCFVALAVLGCAETQAESPAVATTPAIPDTAASIVVAGGCFWCVESDFEKQPGVYEAISGYSGGDKRDATYRDHDGHREAVEIFYDPTVTDYATLLHVFFRSIDPTDADGQFCDRGYEYTTAVYPRTDAETRSAEAARDAAAAQLAQPVTTAIDPFRFIVNAEDYHQDYYKKNPLRYSYYRNGCGRDARVKKLWGDDAISH